MPEHGSRRRPDRGGGMRQTGLGLALRIAAAAVSGLLVAEALALPVGILIRDHARQARIEQDVRPLLNAVLETGAQTGAGGILRRGRSLVEEGVLLGGALYDRDGHELGDFGQAPKLGPAEAVRSRTDASRGTVELVLPPEETRFGYVLVVSARLPGFDAAPFRDGPYLAAAGLAGAALGTPIVLGLLWVWMLRPLARMRNAAKSAAAAPDSAPRFRLGWSRRDEIGEMARTLDQLFSAVSAAYREELADLEANLASSAVAILCCDNDGRPLRANAAALALFGVADLDALQELDPACVRGIGTDEAPWRLLPELADEPGLHMRVLLAAGAEKRCLVEVLPIAKGDDGDALRYAVGIVDLSTQYDYVRRLEASTETLASENETLARSATELRQLLESCLTLLERVPGAAAVRDSAPGSAAHGDPVNEWFGEASQAGLVAAPLRPFGLPELRVPPASARRIFRQALLLASMCGRGAQPRLAVEAEVTDGRAVFAIRDLGPDGAPPRSRNWPLPFAALQAALYETEGSLVSFSPNERVMLRFALPAGPVNAVFRRPAAA